MGISQLNTTYTVTGSDAIGCTGTSSVTHRYCYRSPIDCVKKW
ncbi:hypothetical protein EMGBS15_13670 [Filimonas sp.]|nr:hypothetical protein EMGBS15_13670 [Filimonas sp.]